MGTDLDRHAPARPDALTLTLAPRVARSLARFVEAGAFNQDLSGWNTAAMTSCYEFCLGAGFNPTSRIPSFPGTCGDPGC